MLKKIFYLSILTLVVTACKNEPKIDGFLINGTIDASENGKKVTLYKLDNKTQVLLDTARVANGKVTLKGNVAYPDIYTLTLEGNFTRFPIVIENTEMNLALNKDSLMGSKVTGSKENEVFDVFKSNMISIKEKNAELMAKYQEASKNKDTATIASLRQMFEGFVAQVNEKNLDVVKQHNNLVVSATMLDNLINTKTIKIKKAKEVFDAFSEHVKNSPIGVKLNEKIEKEIITAEGSVAPNFSAPNPNGEMISLNEIKGKVTIIDFWAAWCGPCRKENPNVVKVYNKYHDKGLEIIGVSLDGTPRQKDAKAAWLEAIEKDGLTWNQVSNLQYFNDPVAKLYNIRAIPATYVLDAKGVIVAKNLRGDELDKKVAELLN